MPTPSTPQAAARLTTPRCERQQHQPSREHKVGQREHAAAAAVVDRSTNGWAENGGQQQRAGESTKNHGARQVETACDRVGKNSGQIITRCPGQGLRRTQRPDHNPAFHSRRAQTAGLCARRSYHPRVRSTIRTTESITGTSTSTPTTVASAAPD